MARPIPWLALLCGLACAVTAALAAFRIEMAPDLFSDEALYASVARNLAAGRGLVEDAGNPFVWHPPLFPLIESAVIRLFGLAELDMVSLIFRLRLINALAAGATAALLVLIGARLRGDLCGAIVGLLYCLDPYVQRISRRAMLEPTAVGLLVLGLALFLLRLDDRRKGLLIGALAGVALGLAMLVRELMLLGGLVILAFALIYRRDLIGRALTACGAMLGVYGIYPAWMFAHGIREPYVTMKQSQLLRMVSKLAGGRVDLADAAPLSASRIGLAESVAVTIGPYLTSYMLLAAAGLLVPLLLAVHRATERRADGLRLTLIWAGLFYAVIGGSVVFGNSSDHLFYMLIVPAVLLAGFALAVAVEWLAAGRGLVRAASVSMLLAGAIAIGWNAVAHWRTYGRGVDNSYAALYQHVRATIPPGSRLVAGSDLANYLFADYEIEFHRDLAVAAADDEARYYIFSTKERWGGYNEVTPELYDWVAAHSAVRFEQYGATFWKLRLFERSTEQVADG